MLAPEKGWSGSGEEYLSLMRERWATDRKMRIGIAFTSRFFFRSKCKRTDVEGPYAAEALKIMQSVVGQKR